VSTGQLIILDLLAAVAVTGGWLGAGAASTAGRRRVAVALTATAAVATLARVGTVVALAGAGWWFVQEKVTIALPLLGAALLVLPVLKRPLGLLTAGYAAAAGLGVTFLAGYPASWSAGLVAVAVVGLAALVTWRALAPVRNTAMVVGFVVVGVLGAGLGFVPPADLDTGGGPPGHHSGVPVDQLRGPDTPAPGGEVRRLALTAQTATVTLASGRQIDAWTYDAQVPGPPITARQGDLLEVTLRNTDIEDGVTLHWHGYDVPSGEDGAPGLTQAAVAPGEEFVYRFRADQVGSYWYHTHSASHPGVRKGLYGTLVVQPRTSDDGLDLTVPVHTFADGVTVFGDSDQPDERQVAPGTPVRLRLVNTDSDPRRFALAGARYRLAAVDGTDLADPGELERVGLRLAAGGRYDLTFAMPDRPVTLTVGDAAGLRLLPEGYAGEPETPDTAGWPELDLLHYGSPAPVPFERFDREFTLVLDRGLALVDGVPQYAQTVNGRAYSSIPTQLVREGDLVRVTVVNRSLETHPWHLHGHRVLVLSRDAKEPTGSPLWLDTFDVRPGEVWQVGFEAANPGLWMNHCHNLPHAEQGMMLHLAYDGVSSPFHAGMAG
jgi:FtsP/CotA-like multicopper oxidase with cupredoxin domain